MHLCCHHQLWRPLKPAGHVVDFVRAILINHHKYNERRLSFHTRCVWKWCVREHNNSYWNYVKRDELKTYVTCFLYVVHFLLKRFKLPISNVTATWSNRLSGSPDVRPADYAFLLCWCGRWLLNACPSVGFQSSNDFFCRVVLICWSLFKDSSLPFTVIWYLSRSFWFW